MSASGVRAGDALYVEYDGGEAGYYDLIADPLELHNVAWKLSAAKRKQLHDALRANAQCQGPQCCWSAQRIAA